MKVLLLGDEGNGRAMWVRDLRDLLFAVYDDDDILLGKPHDPERPVPKPKKFAVRYSASRRLSTDTLGVMVCDSVHPESDKAVELMHNLAGSGSAEPTGLVVNGLAIYIAPGQHDDFTSRAIETLRKAINTSEKVFWQAVRDIADEIRGP